MNKIIFEKLCYGLVAVLLMTSCTPTLKVTGTWVNKEKVGLKQYHNVFIFALAEKFEVKTQLEMNLAFAAVDKGLNVVKSTDIFPYTFSKDNIPNRELLIEKIQKLGCDAVLTVVPVRKESETRYVPGSVAYTPMSTYGYYGNFYSYYNYYTPVVYSSGYYETNKTYFLESNLYDFATGDLLWSMQSEAVNPSSIEAFSKQYTDMLVQELKKVAFKRK